MGQPVELTPQDGVKLFLEVQGRIQRERDRKMIKIALWSMIAVLFLLLMASQCVDGSQATTAEHNSDKVRVTLPSTGETVVTDYETAEGLAVYYGLRGERLEFEAAK